ncbi:hypothetical protein EGH21_09035 [Halomicroarcula sp. F13]|uniref:Transposase n=1 Tax=Haloarcula rubra TaxID=2487747 RepID=A0AAW4PPM9_9EURY|nr:hypothetical protein [Halomicroarcula rubra]MBX0323171.1 hypothetical protein [Halomicroarcula rubra]
MSGHLTSDEWQRITEFARTPKHRRRPEQLLPDEAMTDPEGDANSATD